MNLLCTFRHRWLFLFVTLVCAVPVLGICDDRVSLDHDAYDQWKSVSSRQLSGDGKWFSYQTSQGWGEKESKKLWLRNTESDVEHSIAWGRGAAFSKDSKFVLMIVDPDPAAVKKAVADKIPEEQRPTSYLAIMNLETGKIRTSERVRSFTLPEDGNDWVAYLVPETTSPTPQTTRQTSAPEVVPRQNSAGVTTLVRLLTPVAKPEGSAAKPEGPAAQKKAAVPGPAVTTEREPSSPTRSRGSRTAGGTAGATSSGSTLVVEQLSSGVQWRFPSVTAFQFDKLGTHLAWVSGDENKESTLWLAKLETTLSPCLVISAVGSYASLVFDQAGQQLAFVHESEPEGKKPSLTTVHHYATSKSDPPREVVAATTAGVPEGWSIQQNTPLSFSKSGTRLFFNTTPKTVGEAEDSVSTPTESDVPTAKLDLWHWSEPLLQTVQQAQVNRLRRTNYRAVFHLESNQVVQLANAETPTVVIAAEDDSQMGLMVTGEPYHVERTWEAPGFSDVWLVDVRNGKRERIFERTQNQVQISPAGNYVYWWDGQERHWFAMSTKNKRIVKLTEQIPQPLFNEDHDTPMLPPSYGAVGWTENDRQFWVQDRFDLWRVDPTGKQVPYCLTQGIGRERQIRLRRVRLEPEERYLPAAGQHLLSAFSDQTKGSGYFRLQVAKAAAELKELILMPESIGDLVKAKEADTVVVTRQDFRRFPDNWKTDLNFGSFARLTQVNSQQNNYRWGSAELTKWNSSTGRELQGIVYKPDNFDPNYQYPLIVYYYERSSNNLHRYYAPAAGRSTINFSFYPSRGYVVFVPDIVYQAGSPGQSAMECILPGVDHLVQQGFIDEKRMGLQGHSWGGYQTAYLVSQTDRFAAAEAGAPVSNMTSAYGGIRWESGLSRMFQYERTQSRIGQTLWENREAYIENSPLFFADRIRTPLLILHNDQDGAVPWYQGIELFMALRRLERPAWLVNYNGEPHGISKEENRRDFAVRMQQFFDHYLQDAPPPKWMVSGIPATEKGKDLGLELVDPATLPSEKAEDTP